MKPRSSVIAVAALLFAAPAPAFSQSATPAPAATGAQPLGYYIMQGNRIVSQPFPNVAACTKALATLQKTVAPGNDTLVCAHRRP